MLSYLTSFTTEEEKEKEVANMCFMAINELNKVNFNFSDEDMHDVFEELYEDFEKLSLKNISLKKKIQQLEEVSKKISIVEISKTHLEKRKWDFEKEKWMVDLLSFNIFLWTKIFEMILASQKYVFDKQGLGFKSSKNQSILKTIL